MTIWAFREERREEGLGLKLVAALVKQLSASVEIVSLPPGIESISAGVGLVSGFLLR
jgi:hypothetical protein